MNIPAAAGLLTFFRALNFDLQIDGPKLGHLAQNSLPILKRSDLKMRSIKINVLNWKLALEDCLTFLLTTKA